MHELPRRAARKPHDVLKSRALARWLNEHDPTDDPVGWQISDTGTVWTEAVAFPGRSVEHRAQVIAIEPGFYLLAVPLCDVEGLYTPQDVTTLAAASAYLEGRNTP
jgi:hypothetical protein